MSACEALVASASHGIAPALRAIDCLSNEMAASAFGRLFGPQGALLPVLTAALTLYVAVFALTLLTGRTRIGVNSLVPRMLTLGLVLTFATSWIAYQGVVWNLAIGGPDQIAGLLTGGRGPATQIFADKLDVVFAAIGDIASGGNAEPSTAAAGAATATAGQATRFTPGDLLWLAAILLLLGTVGVLLTARIALAVLLAIGPVFVVFALFPGTRGLTAGWLRGLVLTAITPLFVVLGGSLMLELLVPVIAAMRDGGEITGRGALAFFTIAAVHVALMGMVLKVAGTIVSGWRLFGLSGSEDDRAATMATSHPTGTEAPVIGSSLAHPPSRTGRLAVAASGPELAMGAFDGRSDASVTRRIETTHVAAAASTLPPFAAQRRRGVGSRFRATPAQFREKLR